MLINFNKIVTCSQFENLNTLDEKRYNNLAAFGNKERQNFETSHPALDPTSKFKYITKRADEIVFNKEAYKSLLLPEKEILASEFLFPDSEKFAFYLNNHFTIEELQTLSSILEKCIRLYKGKNQTREFSLDILNQLDEKISSIYGYGNPDHYITKINGIIVNDPKLFTKHL